MTVGKLWMDNYEWVKYIFINYLDELYDEEVVEIEAPGQKSKEAGI